MELNDLATLFLNINENVDFYWNFYAITLISISAWIFSLKTNLLRRIKIILSIGFMVFSGMNLTALLWNYTFLDAITIEMQALLNAHAFQTSLLPHTIQQLSFSHYYLIVFLVHIIADLGILMIIWSDKIRSSVE